MYVLYIHMYFLTTRDDVRGRCDDAELSLLYFVSKDDAQNLYIFSLFQSIPLIH